MRQSDQAPGSSLAPCLSLRVPALGLAIASLACARSDEAWMRDLVGPGTDPFQRGMAAIALAEQAPERSQGAVMALLVLLDGPRGSLRSHAAEAMKKIAPWSVDELCGVLVQSPFLSEDCRAAVEDALVASGELAVPCLLTVVREPADLNPRRFGLLLARIGDPAVDPLLRLAREDPSPGVRVSAIWTLGRCGEAARRALPALEEMVRGNEGGPASAAAEAVGRIDPDGESTLALLREALESRRQGVRVSAAQALAHVLTVRSSEATEAERQSAFREVVSLGDPILPAVIEDLDTLDPADEPFAKAAVCAIVARWSLLPRSARRSPRPITTLTAELTSGVTTIRGPSTLELAKMGAPASPATRVLLRAVADEHAGVRTGAALALALIAVDLAWVR